MAKMTLTRGDLAALAVAWVALAGFVVLVCVLLPTPPAVPSAPHLTLAMLDFFFGAVAIALFACVISVVLAFRFARGAVREMQRTLDERIAQLAGGERNRSGTRGDHP